jgi:predicted DNA-binding protein
VSAPNKSLRLPDALVERLETYAKANGIKFSAAVRLVLQRGIAVIEQESIVVQPRRKVISKGVF